MTEEQLSLTANYLCEAVDSIAANIETISESLDNACQLVTNTLLNDHKLIICGNGHSAPIASLLTTCFMHQLEFERPSLPAVNISIDSTTISAIAKDGNYHHSFAKQIRALGTEGDTLIALSIDGNCGNIVQAIQTAHEKGIKVITIIGFSEGKMSAIKQGEDIEILLETQTVARAMEAQMVTANAMCHQIENHLFGGAF